MIIEAANTDSTEELAEVATFTTNFLDDLAQEEEAPELNTWICELLDLYDDHSRTQDAYMVDINLTDLTEAMSNLSIYATVDV